MRISIENISKKYKEELVISNFSYVFETNKSYAITGNNGSGKSTLLQIIANIILPTKGNIFYHFKDNIISNDLFYKHNSFAAPYIELIEEYTALEQVEFHNKFKQLNLPFIQILENCGLKKFEHKKISSFSSGMKQRLKLALSFYNNYPVLLLDEPTTNLDTQGINWYLSEIQKLQNSKIIIIASNNQAEYADVNEIIDINNYK